MASKNLGAVIQRAISDGAFRRQLQSDPAAALRGFNLTPDEVAAIRSGDSGKLMGLGVDQRMSKAFTVGGGFLGATRSTTSDLSAGGTASTIASDNTAGTREGIVGDPTAAGVRSSVNDVAPFGSTGSSAIEDPNSPEYAASQRAADLSTIRSVNDVAPFGSTGSSAIEDASSPENAASQRAADTSTARPIHDDAPADLRSAATDGTAAAAAGRGSSFAGDMSNVDNVAAAEAGRGGSLADMSGITGNRSVNDVAPFGTTGTSAVEDANSPESVASRMADTGDASSVRPINDVAPFEGNVNAAATDGAETVGDARLDPGIDSSHTDAASNTGETGDEHGWG